MESTTFKLNNSFETPDYEKIINDVKERVKKLSDRELLEEIYVAVHIATLSNLVRNSMPPCGFSMPNPTTMSFNR